jgi:alpha-L-rhamnosidase
VQIWDADNDPSEWSDVSHWSVGLLEHSDWKGDWISMENNHAFETSENVTFMADDPARGILSMRPAKYFRREFKAHSRISRATLYATARGVYEIAINGERVGDQYLAPGWTDYHKRVYYQTYDVTKQLHEEGLNAIGAILADGWYAGYVGYGLFVQLPSNPSGRGFYGETPSLLLQLEIEYVDGTRESVTTDRNWKTALGPITETDILMGESYDARKELGDWSSAGFEESNWEAVAVSLPYTGKLEAHPGVPVRIIEEIETENILEPESGIYIFDLGQNISGIPRLKIRGEPGLKIKIRTGEMIRPDHTLLTANLRCARSTDIYICKGNEEGETWSPQFTYHGFQYVEVSGLKEKPTREMIMGLVMHSDTPLTGSFECSDPVLNKLYSNIVWTQRANFLEVPTDCPQRDERLGWTGDAQVFVNAATFNADIAAFYKKWLVDLRDSQWDYGAYPGYAPRPFMEPGFGHGTGWMDAGVICPWTIWKVYGDRKVIESSWQSMEIFMRFRQQRDPQMLGQNEGTPWGDWLNLDQPTKLEYIDLCYYAYTAAMMADMAQALELEARAKYYRDLRIQIEKSFANLHLVGDGRLSENTQTAYAMALFMDLFPTEQIEAAGRHLAGLVEENGSRMATGFLGTRHMLQALTKSGQHKLAVRLILSKTYPSWCYSVVNGATTIWERWNSYIKGVGANNESMNSFSHYSLGSVSEWMFQHLVGLILLEPGWKKIRISPNPTEDLTWVSGSYQSPSGPISVSWKNHKITT